MEVVPSQARAHNVTLPSASDVVHALKVRTTTSSGATRSLRILKAPWLT